MAGAISRAEVEHVARLAHLDLSDAELDEYTEQLARILEYMAAIGEVDTDGVPPTAHGLPAELIRDDLLGGLREDVPTPSLPREAVLEQAPSRVGGGFGVPAVRDET